MDVGSIPGVAAREQARSNLEASVSGRAKDFPDNPCVPTIDQPLFPAIGVVHEPVVIKAKELQNGGLEVVGCHSILDGPVTHFIGGAVGHATLDPASREPGRESLTVVVAAGGRVRTAFGHGQPADLASPVDEGRIEQPALL